MLSLERRTDIGVTGELETTKPELLTDDASTVSENVSRSSDVFKFKVKLSKYGLTLSSIYLDA